MKTPSEPTSRFIDLASAPEPVQRNQAHKDRQGNGPSVRYAQPAIRPYPPGRGAP